MKRWHFLLFTSPVLAVVAGCASDRPALSEEEQEAIRFNQRGQLAFKLGDYATAVEEYKAALAIHRSRENAQGIAIELMNLALAHRQLGDKVAAQDALDPILTAPGTFFPPLHQAEAAYRRAGFYLDDGNIAQAQQWTDKALQYCGGCAAEGRLYNLKARMSLAVKSLPQAMNHARRALDLNRNAGDPIEEANSLRLIGDAAFVAGDFNTAQQFYDDAFRLDKEAGSAKMALDLMGLGRSRVRQGKAAEAADFFRRAHSIAQGAGDARIMKEASAELKRLTP